MKIENENIDFIFKQAQQLKPLLEIDEVEAVVSTAEIHSKSVSTGKGKSIMSLKNLIIMTTILSIVLIGLNLLTNNTDNLKITKEPKTNRFRNKVEVSKEIDAAYKMDKAKPIFVSDGINAKEVNNQSSNNEEGSKFSIDDISTVKLSLAELKALGFKSDGEVIQWNNYIEGTDKFDMMLDIDIKKTGVNCRTGSKKAADNKEDRPEGLPYYPMYVSQGYNQPLMIYTLITESVKKNRKDYVDKMRKHLIPIEISSLQEEDYPWLFWFTPTSSFFSALPTEQREKVRNDFLKRSDFNWSSHIIDHSYEVEKLFEEHKQVEENIKNIIHQLPILELPSAIYNDLGLQVSDKMISYEGMTEEYGLMRFNLSKRSISQSVDDKCLSDTLSGGKIDFYPIMITDVKGGQNYFKGQSEFFNSQFLRSGRSFLCLICKQGEVIDNLSPQDVNTLLPIHVGKDIEDSDGFVVWFKVSPSFFETLPEEIGGDMLAEYNYIMNKNINDEGRKKDGEVSSGRCHYFEVCRYNISGLHGFNLYPNPVKNEFSLTFHLEKAMKIKVDLLSLKGTLIKELSIFKQLSAGENKLVYNDINNLAPGIYLLALESFTGQKMTQRIVIQ